MTLIQKNSDRKILDKITYLTGDSDVIERMPFIPAKEPFSEDICSFLSDVSKLLLSDRRSRNYPDVVTFAFWIRNASLNKMKKRFDRNDYMRIGRGVAFHVAPSNVPVNFAYSLAAGLITGNGNIVRIPSREFSQVGIITDAIHEALQKHENMQRYIALIRYGHDRKINDWLSGIANVRVVWGGDATIAELRKSPLAPRSREVTFADRYSLAVIDSETYMAISDKKRVAEDFYNDTYLTDQNACTSPMGVIWTGKRKDEAKKEFWDRLHDEVEKRYEYQDIQGVNKLASAYLSAAVIDHVKVVKGNDNLIVRVQIPKAKGRVMDLKDNSGYFFEFDCDDVMELRELCDDVRCQTVGVIGDKAWLEPLVKSGIKGIDRVAAIGKTMDFDLIWDGYDLIEEFTRIIVI